MVSSIPIGDPAIVVAFDVHTVVEQFEVEIGARIEQENSKKSFLI